MSKDNPYQSDIDLILSHRHDNGADFWATPDNRLYVGSPYSTTNSAMMLYELGVPAAHEAMAGAASLVLACWRKDGRYSLGPSGTLHPCYTAAAANVLCRLGYAGDERLERTFTHLLESQHTDGGWRCGKFFYGRGPETEFSNPGATLGVLDAFRFTGYLNTEEKLDRAVESLLRHWETRLPLGPCHYGIGTQFLRVEYPFMKYNILYYVYVLSHYVYARQDGRFLAALAHLKSRLRDGEVVVENTNRMLKGLEFCRKGAVSAQATTRYREILANML